MTVSVTLKQEKTILADTFRVWSWITAATPAELYPLFVMEAGIDPWEETFLRVADSSDLAAYDEDPLSRFTNLDTVNFGTHSGSGFSVAEGDTLEITVVPADWASSTVITSFVYTIDAPVTDDTSYICYIKVSDILPEFPDARNDLHWNIKRNGAILENGIGELCEGVYGYTSRRDATASPYLRRSLLSLFDDVTAAENRYGAIETGVMSIANAEEELRFDDPPNPSIHTYPTE